MAETLEYRGSVELEINRYPNLATNKQQVGQERAFKLRWDTSYKTSTDLAFGARTFIRKDADNKDRDAARFDELWGQCATSQWDVRVGNQLVTWGSVESVSPLDIINPRDYKEDLVEPIKIGITMMRARRRLDDGEFSLYWLPYYEASQLPGPQSFYSFSGGLPTRYPTSIWNGDQFAARYFYTGDGFDYGISYFRGFERNARFNINQAGDELTGRAYRSQRLGLEATKVVRELLLKGEFVFRTTLEEGNRRALLYALGTEYTISSVWRNSDMTLFVEYLASSHNVSEIEQMQNDIYVAARWTISDHYKQILQAGLSKDLDRSQSYVYRVKYAASPIENIDAGIYYTYTKNYFPGPRYIENIDGVLHAFLKYNF